MEKENKIVVRGETLPERCDICHQSDLFDQNTGICSRCNGINEIDLKRKKEYIESEYNLPLFLQVKYINGKVENKVLGKIGKFIISLIRAAKVMQSGFYQYKDCPFCNSKLRK